MLSYQENQIKKCAQVVISLDWALSLLKEVGDEEKSLEVKKIRKKYNDLAFSIMRENNIRNIRVSPTKSKTVELSIDNVEQLT